MSNVYTGLIWAANTVIVIDTAIGIVTGAACVKIIVKEGIKVVAKTGAKEGIKNLVKKIDANKIRHIFDKAQHNLDDIVKHYGSKEAAYRAMQSAMESHVAANGITGVFEEVVKIAGQNVTIRGIVQNGVVRIGTAFK